MKSKYKILAIIILILISTQTSYSIDKIISTKDFVSVKDTLKVDNHIKVNQCSMHPEKISNEPGLCSKCGMQLIQKDSKISKWMMGMGMMHHKSKNRGLLYVGMGLMMIIMMAFKIF